MSLQYHKDSRNEAINIKQALAKYGIAVNLETGLISYVAKQNPQILCHSLYFLRHADTIGTLEHRFMSDDSKNGILVSEGKDKLLISAKEIDCISPDMILYSDIQRVRDTAEVIHGFMGKDIPFIKLPWMKGINNAGWENMRPNELLGMDKEDYVQREIKHNIYAKSEKGTSWGTVLVTAIQLFEYLNNECRDKKVLIISQGSLLYALKIILRLEEIPWSNYCSQEFYNLVSSGENLYGIIQMIKA